MEAQLEAWGWGHPVQNFLSGKFFSSGLFPPHQRTKQINSDRLEEGSAGRNPRSERRSQQGCRR